MKSPFRRPRAVAPWPGPLKLLGYLAFSFVVTWLALSTKHNWPMHSAGERWAWLIGGAVFCTFCLAAMDRYQR